MVKDKDNPATEDGLSLQPGDRVTHPRFKMGTVQYLRAGKVGVDFDSGAMKEIAAPEKWFSLVPQWREGRISPSWKQINHEGSFLPGLTAGERELAKYFDDTLPDDWRVFVRPHLDGDLPSLAILSPAAGGMLWEVVEPRSMAVGPVSPGSIGQAPLHRLEQIRHRIYNEYMPVLAEEVAGDRRKFGTIQLGIYFPTHERSEVAGFLQGVRASIVTKSELSSAHLGSVVPIISKHGTLSEARWKQLVSLFGHYASSPAALEALQLRPDQASLATPRPGRHHITGVAGSGKSVVIAHRAVGNAMAGRRVLVLTYNRTLTNYLRYLISQVPGRYPRDRITIRHFHGLCSELSRTWPYLYPAEASDHVATGGPADNEDQAWFEFEAPARALEAIQRGVPPQWKFDTVLVDEGQDFSGAFLDVVEKLCPGVDGEIVIASDNSQRMYDRAPGLADGELARRFKRTRPLTLGVRSPPAVARAANAFITRWNLETPPIDIPEDGLLPDESVLAWMEAGSEAETAAIALDVARDWISRRRLRPDRVAVLVPTKAYGAAFVQLLAERRMAANHVFPVGRTGAPLDDSRDAPLDRWGRIEFEAERKAWFKVKDQRMKVSTVHSFKGWESHHVICVLPAATQPHTMDIAGVYVALTRSRGDLALIGVGDPFGIGGILPRSASERTDVAEDSARFSELVDEYRAEPKGRAASVANRDASTGSREDSRA